MEIISNIIALVALLVSIVGLVLSWRTSKKQLKLEQKQLKLNEEQCKSSALSDYSKSFNNAELKLRSNSSDSNYQKMYFDICSEGYSLYKKEYIPADVWKDYTYRMKLAMKVIPLQLAWEKQSFHYDMQDDFKSFFNQIIKESKANKY